MWPVETGDAVVRDLENFVDLIVEGRRTLRLYRVIDTRLQDASLTAPGTIPRRPIAASAMPASNSATSAPTGPLCPTSSSLSAAILIRVG